MTPRWCEFQDSGRRPQERERGGGGGRDGKTQMEMQIRKQACWLYTNVATAVSVAMIVLLA